MNEINLIFDREDIIFLKKQIEGDRLSSLVRLKRLKPSKDSYKVIRESKLF